MDRAAELQTQIGERDELRLLILREISELRDALIKRNQVYIAIIEAENGSLP
ncbi:MAG: hypothetical protein IMZ50_08725 [Candidatus Atribacteria bacterium]|nr:hypothetical protein [Candidatus Atribacteria bacterium]